MGFFDKPLRKTGTYVEDCRVADAVADADLTQTTATHRANGYVAEKPSFHEWNYWFQRASAWFRRLNGTAYLLESAERTITLGGAFAAGGVYTVHIDGNAVSVLGVTDNTATAALLAMACNAAATVGDLYHTQASGAVATVRGLRPGVDMTLTTTPPGAATMAIAVVTAAPFKVRADDAAAYAADFVHGSPTLNDAGDATHDERVTFRKAAGAFRAGRAHGTQWDIGSTGDASTAFGEDCMASGTGAIAGGRLAVASGDDSLALGLAATAAAGGSVAIGAGSTVPTAASGAMALQGGTVDAAAPDAVASGKDAKARQRGGSTRSGANTLAFDAQRTEFQMTSQGTGDANLTLIDAAANGDLFSLAMLRPKHTYNCKADVSLYCKQSDTEGHLHMGAIQSLAWGMRTDAAGVATLIGAVQTTVPLQTDFANWRITVDVVSGELRLYYYNSGGGGSGDHLQLAACVSVQEVGVTP